MAAGDVKVECPFSFPARLFSEQHFVSFCTASLGVVPSRVQRDVAAWLEEDVGHGDESLLAGLGGNRDAFAVIVAKQEFVLCGLPLMAEVFRQASGGFVEIFSEAAEGDLIKPGTVVLGIKGRASALLLGERTALNVSSRLSGIATKTRYVSEALKTLAPSGKPTLLETRKTTPGHRIYEKYATRLGGARNHRHGLDSGAMLKENHLRAIGNITRALQEVRGSLPILSKVEVEVGNLDEFRVALDAGAHVVMLDNFSWDDVAVAVAERNARAPQVELEVSGNLDEARLEKVACSGVDFASMGALIHKAVWIDMSMQLYVHD